jgi:hypothetical protein
VDGAATGKVVITSRSPANAKIMLRGRGTEIAVSGREAEVPEGTYTLVATAPGHRDQSQQVRVMGSVPALVGIKLTALPQARYMEGWEQPQAWTLQDGWYTRKGGMFVMYDASASNGLYQFAARHKGRALPLLRGGQIQWVANYVDDQNYDLYQLDGERISWRRVVDGVIEAEKRAEHGVKIKDQTYRLQLEVSSGRMAARIRDGQVWRPLPRLESNAAARPGRFGFFLPGNEQIWLSEFEFRPRE